jgi:hypothetical protein
MARTPRLRPGSAWPGPATRRCKTCSPESMTRRSPRLSGRTAWSDAGRRYRLAASSRWSGRWHVISSPGRQETRDRPVTRTSPTPNIPLWARYGSRTGSGIGDHNGGYVRSIIKSALMLQPTEGAVVLACLCADYQIENVRFCRDPCFGLSRISWRTTVSRITRRRTRFRGNQRKRKVVKRY